MWNTLPDELVISVGAFLLHRDARCMQATCVNWEKTWTAEALVVPHPFLWQIRVCHLVHCINRQYIIENVEPMLVFGDPTTQTDIQRLLLFMILLIPVKLLSLLTGGWDYPLLQLQVQRIDRLLIFWCSCERPHHSIHGVCVRSEGLTGSSWPVRMVSRVTTIESLVLWMFIWMLMYCVTVSILVVLITNALIMIGFVILVEELYFYE
jgi:hypothetical protein